MRIRDLARRRRLLAVAALLGVAASVWSVERVSLSPPGLAPRAVSIATAHTSAIVDTPHSIVLDLRADTNDFTGLENRAVLLGNLISSAPVLDYIAVRVHVPVAAIAVSAPATPTNPLPRVIVGHARKVTDLLRYADQYRLSVEASPTAPMLDVYSQAPTPALAATLANAAVDGLQSYMSQLAAGGQVGATDRIRVTQLGRAQGALANPGVDWQLVLLAFVAGAGAALGLGVGAGRVRAGWVLAGHRPVASGE